MSAGLAGLAGALKTLVFGIAALSDVHWHLSGDAIIMAVLGGTGTLLGPLVGAGLLVAVTHAFEGEFVTLVPVLLGSIFMVAVLVFRRGLAGELLHALEYRQRVSVERQSAVAVAGGGLAPQKNDVPGLKEQKKHD